MKPCSICKHRKVREIDRALAAGLPLRVIATLADVGKDSLARHNLHRAPRQFMRRFRRAADPLPPVPLDINVDSLLAANWRRPEPDPTEGDC
jgi:hypothetical protein